MSHFSTIKTQLKDKEPLIKALNNLGYMINQEEKFVKGYKGKFTAVDLSMNLPGDTKVGFKAGGTIIALLKKLKEKEPFHSTVFGKNLIKSGGRVKINKYALGTLLATIEFVMVSATTS